jgi:hypothetical protein
MFSGAATDTDATSSILIFPTYYEFCTLGAADVLFVSRAEKKIIKM